MFDLFKCNKPKKYKIKFKTGILSNEAKIISVINKACDFFDCELISLDFDKFSSFDKSFKIKCKKRDINKFILVISTELKNDISQIKYKK